MIIGLDSYSYHLHLGRHGWSPSTGSQDLFWFIRRAAGLGIQAVQIDPAHMESWEDSHLLRVREALEQAGLTVEAGTGGCEFEKLSHRLQASRTLGARCLRTFLGGSRDPEPVRREKMAFAVDQFRRLAPVAEKAGVPIALENHCDLTAPEVLEILDAVASPWIGACLDTGNSVMVDEDPLECCRILVSRAHSVHVKDLCVLRTARGCPLDEDGMALGEGELDVNETLHILRALPPEIPITIEIPCLPRDDEEETLRWEDACVQESIRYLRGRRG